MHMVASAFDVPVPDKGFARQHAHGGSSGLHS